MDVVSREGRPEGASWGAQRGRGRPSSRARLAAVALVAGTLLLLIRPAPAEDAALEGRVVRVVSGDTLVVASASGDVEVRLADIGAPQGSDYFAPAARTLLASLALDKIAQVTVTGRGGPDRLFGRVRVGALDVNLELVRRGAAWMCLEYAADTSLMPWEHDAQRERRGLWRWTWEVDIWAECRRRPPAERPVSAGAATASPR